MDRWLTASPEKSSPERLFSPEPSSSPLFFLLQSPPACRRPSVELLAEDKVLSQTSFARLLIFGTHVLAGFGQSLDRSVEIDAMTRCDFVRRDHVCSPGLHCAKCAPFDARDLHI